jgi:phosphoribosylglycinamide formyltransferase-1
MKNIAVLASGSGSNAENLYDYFRDKTFAKVAKIYTNKANAGVIDRAVRLNIPVQIFTKQQLVEGVLTKQLVRDGIDVIVLAGFLQLIPKNMLDLFAGRIVNIHPSLLPNYGGKGMFGMKVHEAVIQNAEQKSGITIHLVNAEYDKGEILFQANVDIEPGWSPEDLGRQIHLLEYKHFPTVVEAFIQTLD